MDIKALYQGDVTKPSIVTLMPPLQEQYGIDFISYERYYNKTAEFYQSDSEDLSTWLTDQQSCIPPQVLDTTEVVRWQAYCSDDFLQHLKESRQLTSKGALVYMNHGAFAEHVSIGTKVIENEIHRILVEDRGLCCRLVNYIRTSVNTRRDEYRFTIMETHDSII